MLAMSLFSSSLLTIFGYDPYFFDMTHHERTRAMPMALIWISFGIVAFIVGYQADLGRRAAMQIVVVNDQFSSRRLLWMIVFYSLAGGAIYYFYLSTSSGGVTFSLDDFTSKRRSDYSFLGLIGYSMVMLTNGLGVIYYSRNQRKIFPFLVMVAPILVTFMMALLKSSA